MATKPKRLKLEGYQVNYLIRNWNRMPVEKITLHLNGSKPSPKTTVSEVSRFAKQLNEAVPTVCGNKDLLTI